MNLPLLSFFKERWKQLRRNRIKNRNNKNRLKPKNHDYLTINCSEELVDEFQHGIAD